MGASCSDWYTVTLAFVAGQAALNVLTLRVRASGCGGRDHVMCACVSMHARRVTAAMVATDVSDRMLVCGVQ